MRLGFGEYGTEQTEQDQARGLFFRVLRSVAPQVEEGLLGGAVPAYEELHSQIRAIEGLPDADLDHQWWLGLLSDLSAYPARVDVAAVAPKLHGALVEWSIRFHLQDEWCIHAAVAAVAHFRQDREAGRAVLRSVPAGETYDDFEFDLFSRILKALPRDAAKETVLQAYLRIPQPPSPRLMPSLPTWRLLSEDGVDLPFEHPGWDPTLSKWKGYKASVIEHLAAYGESVRRNTAARLDLRPSPQRRLLDQHLRWLVLYQVPGALVSAYPSRGFRFEPTYTEVADAVYSSREGVADAVKMAADVIDLTPRPSPPGAPKGPRRKR